MLRRTAVALAEAGQTRLGALLTFVLRQPRRIVRPVVREGITSRALIPRMREADTQGAKYAWPIIVCGAVLAAQGGFVPALFRDGALPQIPIQAIGGGEVRLELTVSSSGVVSAVKTLRATPSFTDAMSDAVRGWRFRPAEEETEPKPGSPGDPKPRRPVESKVLVVGMFRPPTLNAPTFGEPPKDVASPSNETPFPLASVMPSYPPPARENGIVLVEVRVDPSGGVADVKVIRSAPPFDGPARDAARRWTFRPARVNGGAVTGFVYIVFAFRQPIVASSLLDFGVDGAMLH